ncbi:MAG: DUF262 domain-containing protein [Terracidiphilus sp.]|jgi:uncharacterized protein with ParB-like and HNH nuclease domain
MSFQAPITIRKVLENIDSKRYFLPAIQREFVWDTSQIEQLFDSVLRGYPIGSFLFWLVSPQNSKEYEFYEFIRDYHELKHRHNQKAEFFAKREVTAILDGQQRLTALNIGLRGSYASKVKWKKKSSPDSYPTRHLCLNLLRPLEESETGAYEFSFLSDTEASTANGKHWFRAGKILDFKSPKEVNSYLAGMELANNEFAYSALFDFYQRVNESAIINYYQEDDQDLDKVLRIFIRVNSGGTQLGYSDLLLSTATAQWKSMNAREEINALVEQLNGPEYRFAFSKDFVMKACLVLTDDITDIRFKVTNFNASNTKKIEGNWKKISGALKQSVGLLASFGFTERSLTSANSVLPIAYYLLKRSLPASYESAQKYASDRKAVHQWLMKSLLRGAFGAQGDTVLSNLRNIIKTTHELFPSGALADRLQQMNRPIRFTDEDVDDLLATQYNERQTFLVLALLYPWVDYRNLFHLDHIHPRSMFTRKALRQAGVVEADIEFCLAHYDDIPNLQILSDIPNIEKSSTPFDKWLVEKYPTKKARNDYCERQFIPDVDYSLANFREFFETRSSLLRDELRIVLQS